MAAPDEQQDDGKQGRRISGRAIAELPVLLVIALVIAFLLKSFVAQPFYIPSSSMEPQLQIGDRVLVSRLAYRFHDPRRGDLIVFPSPEATAKDTSLPPVRLVRDLFEGIGLAKPKREMLIKRVIGLPGETVESRGGRVYVNGELLVEPYLQPTIVTPDFAPTTIPEGRLWVMGDNRQLSRDSHVFGPIDAGGVIGRAVFKVWPPLDASFL